MIISKFNSSVKQKDDFELVFEFWRVRQNAYFSNRLIQRKLAAKKNAADLRKKSIEEKTAVQNTFEGVFSPIFLRSASIKKINSFLREITKK